MRGIRQIASIVMLGIAVLFLQSEGSFAQQGGIIDQIRVEGAQRVEPGTVRSYLLVQPGDVFDANRIDQSLKSLFATGLFADVTIRRFNNDLVINVIENPIINRVAFEGNKDISDEDLEAEISLRPRVIFTRSKVQNDLQRVLVVYRRSGRFAATVEPKVIQLPQNRVDLVFEINEGEQTKVESIRFVGNQAYDDGDLRSVIQTKEDAFYRILANDATYDPDRLTLDRELLRNHYLENGYADFRVESAVAELTPERENFLVTFTVSEGERYRLGPVDIQTSLPNLDVAALKEELDLEEGDWYDAVELEKAIDKISDQVGEFGFAFVEVRPRINRDRENRLIEITFEVNEGPRVFVERIDIVGNSRTQDKVVRREFRLVEGDAFNATKLRRSRQRITNLNFFETVDLEQLPGSAPDKTVLKVSVQEKSTGSIGIGAGFSTQQGVLGDFSIREENLLGRGQSLGLRLVLASRRSQIDLQFTEPYFLDREIAAGFDLFRVREDFQDFSSFDQKRTGAALRAGYPITENLFQSWRYELKSSEIDNVDDDASPVIQDEEGKRTISEVSHTITYEQRDNVADPTSGYFARLRTDFSGLFGDVDHFRNTVTAAYYVPVSEDVVLTIGGVAGLIVGFNGDEPILQERFFTGGDDLRGFQTAGIGPRDTDTNDSLGSEWKYTATAELRFPLGLPAELGIGGRAFVDAGSAGGIDASGPDIEDEGSLRMSTGFGVTWDSPFGPLGVDLGFPILKEDFDETETFRVNFGTRF